MTSQAMRAQPRADAQYRARVLNVGRQLRRFRPENRGAIGEMALRHARLGELALSFPALLLALARPRAGFDPAPVAAGVIAGAPLARLAEAARVPLWLRRVKPQLLPVGIPILPDSAFFARAVVNHLPRHERHVDAWFDCVARAGRWSHDGFALWCARVYARTVRRRDKDRLNLLCLWAWYSLQNDLPGHALIDTPWTPQMELKAAMVASERWEAAIITQTALGHRVIDDVWLEPGEVDGYAFVPLRSAADVTEEARAMSNCVRTHGDRVLLGQMRLWSVRRDGARLATLSVAFGRHDPLPAIKEIKLARNAKAAPALWWAARKWLHAHDVPNLAITRHNWDGVPLDRAAWTALWKPYWLAMGCVPDWLPLMPSRDALWAL
jgi:hypothetical protein